MGTRNIQVRNVPDPQILNPHDAIVKVTSTAICGSDVHLYDGFIPTMQRGDLLGHEFMGEVVEVGEAVRTLRVGDRVVVPFPIACGHCNMCEREMFSLCENSNPNAMMAEELWGYSPCGIFGYSHMLGGYAGGQAEYVRVPYADIGPLKIPDHLEDEQVLFLSDIFPTGYMAAENCSIQPGDTFIYLPKEKILLTGDLLVNPIAFALSCYPSGWLRTLEKLDALDASLIVPGHGEPLRDEALLHAHMDAMRILLDVGRSAKARGLDPDQARDEALPRLHDVMVKMTGNDPKRNQEFKIYLADWFMHRVYDELNGPLTDAIAAIPDR
jgi:hypothetical protein